MPTTKTETNEGRPAVVDFIAAKLAEAEKALKAREQMAETWAGGTDNSWRAVGCRISRAERLQMSATHARIAIRQRMDVVMLKATLTLLQSDAPTPTSASGGEL